MSDVPSSAGWCDDCRSGLRWRCPGVRLRGRPDRRVRVEGRQGQGRQEGEEEEGQEGRHEGEEEGRQERRQEGEEGRHEGEPEEGRRQEGEEGLTDLGSPLAASRSPKERDAASGDPKRVLLVMTMRGG